MARHGTTAANLEGRLQGVQEFPLCGQGKDEAWKLALRLKEIPFDGVYNSPLSRARETAEAVTRENLYLQDLTPECLSLLREFSWGCIEGYTWQELMQEQPTFYQKLKSDFWGTPVSGREDSTAFLQRVRGALETLLSRRGSCGRALVITHGRFINAFLTFALGLDTNGRWPFSPAPASLSILKTFSNGKNRLHLFNDRCHL